jgi:hypothetical protein
MPVARIDASRAQRVIGRGYSEEVVARCLVCGCRIGDGAVVKPPPNLLFEPNIEGHVEVAGSGLVRAAGRVLHITDRLLDDGRDFTHLDDQCPLLFVVERPDLARYVPELLVYAVDPTSQIVAHIVLRAKACIRSVQPVSSNGWRHLEAQSPISVIPRCDGAVFGDDLTHAFDSFLVGPQTGLPGGAAPPCLHTSTIRWQAGVEPVQVGVDAVVAAEVHLRK